MQHAIEALLDADIVLAETVISNNNDLALQAVQTETEAFTHLALQAPVATELR